MNSTRRLLPRRAAAPRGMTLIEIMVVLVILGLVAGMIGYNVFAQLKKAQVQTAQQEIHALENALDLYKSQNGQYPDSLAQLAPTYVKDVHPDPWKHDYVYVKTGDGYEVYSNGPDGNHRISGHGGDEETGQAGP